MGKLKLCIGFHNHQPVGNFDSVIRDAVKKCYAPLLETIAKHEKIKWNVHFSGPLLLWLEKHEPSLITLLRELVERKQIEILGSGFGEPVLCSIPEVWIKRQIKAMNNLLENLFGTKPRGIWLTERVWEPALPVMLKSTGVEFVLVDDYHFFYAGFERKMLDGYYIAEKHGALLKVFPISEALRYRIPFKPVEELIPEMRSWAENTNEELLLTYVDDGEKFGVWPGTYEWVYQKRWLEKFLSALEDNSDWIETTLLSNAIEEHLPKGRVALPTASYREMMEWALPARAATEQEQLFTELGERGFARIKGGFWDQFLVKYEEANRLHKAMLYAATGDISSPEAEKSVLLAQCNDAYWHGLFGGLYLPFLRSALYKHIASASKLTYPGKPVITTGSDFNIDGIRADAVFDTEHQLLVVSGGFGGTVYLWIDKNSLHCYNDVLTRRQEAYHAKVARTAEASNGEEPKSIHEIVRSKEKGLEKHLIYDPFLRLPARLIAVNGNPEANKLRRWECELVGNLHTAQFLKFAKSGKQNNKYIVQFEPIEVNFGINRNFSLERGYQVPLNTVGWQTWAKLKPLSQRNSLENVWLCFTFEFMPLRWDIGGITVEGSTVAQHKFTEDFNTDNATLVRISTGFDSTIVVKPSQPVHLCAHPIETVSISESGFERNFQGCAIYLCLPADEVISNGFELAVHKE